MQHDKSNYDLPMSERVRRGRGRLSRRTVASTKVSLEERQVLEQAARLEGKVLSEWSRDVLLNAARGQRTDAVLMTELTALRMLVSTVLRSIAIGEKLSPEAYQQILVEVRTGKHEAAKDVLAQYQTSAQGDA